MGAGGYLPSGLLLGAKQQLTIIKSNKIKENICLL
jgi:hypothetical protein